MSNAIAQNFKNHSRVDPPYHFVLLGVLVVNLGYAVFHLIRHFDFSSGWLVVLSIVAFILVGKLRTYPLKVQDRVIRLEERLRLQTLAPNEWHTQMCNLTEDQLIGLRFAADDEVVALAKQALEEKLTRKQIKERIKDWRADDWRI
jgi:hypothetical protein